VGWSEIKMLDRSEAITHALIGFGEEMNEP